MPPKKEKSKSKGKGKASTAVKKQKISLKETEFQQKFKAVKKEKIEALANKIETLLTIPEEQRKQRALEEAKKYWKEEISTTKEAGKNTNAALMNKVSKVAETTLGKIAQSVVNKFHADYFKNAHTKLEQAVSPDSQVPLTMVKTEGGLSGPPDLDVTGFFEAQSLAPSSFLGFDSVSAAPSSLVVSRYPPPPLTIGDTFDQPAFASSSSSSMNTSVYPPSPSVAASASSSWNWGGGGSLPPPSHASFSPHGPPVGTPTGSRDASVMGDIVTKNITAGAGGGGEHAMMPTGGLDVEFPTYSMIGGALNKMLKPSLHSMIASQTPNVYSSEMISDGATLRDHTNPPKRSQYLDKALWLQPREPDNCTPHQWYKVADSYSNPAKLNTISCFEKYTLKDPHVNLTGMLGAPFGTDFDDRWTQGTNPFSRIDRNNNLPGTYQDFMVNFLTGNNPN